MNCFEHYLCTFVRILQQDKFLETELLSQSLTALSIKLQWKSVMIEMTFPSNRELCENVPSSNTALHSEPLGELFIPLQCIQVQDLAE